MDLLDRMLEHDRWTTDRILAICRELPQWRLHTHFNVGNATIDSTLRHMIRSMQVWTDLMCRRPVAAPDAVEAAGFDALAILFNVLYADFAACARECRDEGRLDVVFLDTRDDPPAPRTYGSAIIHVITHNMHHRAEILHMLGKLNVPGLPEGDVLSWEREVRG
jgi:uncharacterized damage-inducible protein DinB